MAHLRFLGRRKHYSGTAKLSKGETALATFMIERLIDIPTPGGRMETFLTHPEENGPYPCVIIYMDVWGLREELFDIARRIGTVGYYCVVPDFYYRQGRIRNEVRDEKNRMVTLDRLAEEKRSRVLAPMNKLTDAMVIDDTDSILKFVARGEPVRPGAMGAIGYCLGGRLVLRVGGQFPQSFRALASLHGTNLVTDQEDSPHRLARKLRGELYCGFGEKDRHTPPSTVKALEEAMSGCEVKYRYQIHKGAEHGYALPERDIHDKQAAARDWELIFAMFRRQMPPHSGRKNERRPAKRASERHHRRRP